MKKPRTRKTKAAESIHQVLMEPPQPMARIWIERNARGLSYGVQDVGRNLKAVRRRVQAEFVALEAFARDYAPQVDEKVGGTD
jgi:hypothetical protein